MATLTLLQAVRDGLLTEMGLDERVVLMGEDVGHNGGVFRATEGLQKEFGEDRVMDTPLNESGIIGMAMGMAVNGLRPVPEIQFMDFIYPAFDEIVSEVAKLRYRSGGGFTCPMVIRTPYGGGIRGGHYHSQSSEAYFCHTPGLKVVVPSNPYDTKGLLIASIRDPDPVMFLEPKKLYRSVKGEVPEEPYTVELGKANIVRQGKDVTLLAWGAMVPVCLEAAELSAPRFSYLPTGRIKVEGKEELKRRGVPSPNLADAFVLTMAHADHASVAGAEAYWTHQTDLANRPSRFV